MISQGDNLGELQGPLWQGKARGDVGGKHQNILIKSHLCRLLSASACFSPAKNPCCEPACWRSVCEEEIGEEEEKFVVVRKKQVRKGEDPLHTLPAAAGQALPQEGIRLKDAAAACFDICFTTDMLEKKRLCTELHSWPAHHCNEHHKQGNSCPTAILFCLILSPQPLINCSICF